jgi:hypothetical protein
MQPIIIKKKVNITAINHVQQCQYQKQNFLCVGSLKMYENHTQKVLGQLYMATNIKNMLSSINLHKTTYITKNKFQHSAWTALI